MILFGQKKSFAWGIAIPLLLLCMACQPGRGARIDAAIAKGCSFLSGIQRADGAIADTSDTLFELWETALASTALMESGLQSAQAAQQKSMAFLSQQESASGLICHNIKCKASHCLETSAAYMELLHLAGKKDALRQRATQMAALQKPSGEWEIGNPDVLEQKSFPSVTGFVLAALHLAEVEPPYPAEAEAWLSAQQKPDGTWGLTWEYYQCPAYALWPILWATRQTRSEKMQAARSKALEYITHQQQADGSWHHSDPTRARMPSAALQTALMLSALRYAPAQEYRQQYESGVDFLLQAQQPDGAWDGGFFPVEQRRQPKREYVLATALAIRALIHHRAQKL